MKYANFKILNFVSVLCLFIASSCGKYLDVKPDSSLSTPQTLKDLRALLDNESRINQTYPGLVEVGTDDYYLNFDQISSQYQLYQDFYFWKKELINSGTSSWQASFGTILVANIVLENLENIVSSDFAMKQELSGEAHFLRGLAYYYLSLVYCQTYKYGKENNELGLPLRTSSDFNIKTQRSSLNKTFEFIIAELKLARELLAENVAVKTRPDKTAASAALAKVYLYMQDYQNAEKMALEVYNKSNVLLDYNNLDIQSIRPFPALHDEMIYLAYSVENAELLNEDDLNISPELYNLYEENDLRKRVYFKDKGDGFKGFKGNYASNFSTYFAGLAMDEIYLILAECKTRMGMSSEGLAFLNKLLITRYQNGVYVLPDFASDSQALKYILQERRKELLFRGVRWSDLKRLNLEKEFETRLRREVRDGDLVQTIYLESNDSRYVYPIPEDVILLGGIEQNTR
ncbi:MULTISPECIES: RagB/SusD family nutrient uptake outer membrane protein [unclassified Sphingobacterium]|uniref:RagB/SusD family nutrient uptake outer membrane protein n=1 Tax=unclassified Sphingobacterium TaxID=2609468 RepID=UPI0025FC6C12|nr:MULTISPECIES: RagB/SusD family nutrient uptake outer membrane protein [unclassified Sphingobacterium]